MMNERIMCKAGATDLTISLWLQDALTGEPKAGLTVTDLDYRFVRVEDDNDVTLSAAADVTSLGSLTADHSDGGMYEIGLGAYRFDVPDAVIAAGAVFAALYIWDAGSGLIIPAIENIQLGVSVVDLGLAAKVLLNKAVQTKATGAVQYYDDDGETVILTQTPTDSDTTITRTPS